MREGESREDIVEQRRKSRASRERNNVQKVERVECKIGTERESRESRVRRSGVK